MFQQTNRAAVTVCVCVKSLSRVRLFATPWTVAYQTPPSMGFSRQEYWSGLPFHISVVIKKKRFQLGMAYLGEP